MRATPQNKAMKQTRLSAAPGRLSFDAVAGGAASCPRRRETAGTASQLIAGVRRTSSLKPRQHTPRRMLQRRPAAHRERPSEAE